MGMGPITTIIPRPSTVKLGVLDYQVGEFRLIDIADLQQFLDDRHGDPIDYIRAEIDEQGPEEWERELADAYEEADQPYAFVHGEYVPRSQKERLEQSLHFILTALRQYQPEMTYAKVREIAAELEPGQMSKLNRIVWGTAPIDEIGRLLGMVPRRNRLSLSWPKAIVEILSVYSGYTLADVYRLTLSEFWYLRSGGQPKPEGQWEYRGGVGKAAEKRAAWYKRVMARLPKKVRGVQS